MFGRKKEKTKIVVQYDAGFSNNLYLRGEGIDCLNWQRGLKMKNVKPNEWELTFEGPFKKAEFKVLINDHTFEHGENHKLLPGGIIRVNPKF